LIGFCVLAEIKSSDVDFGHDVHGLPGAQVTEHEIDAGEDADGTAARAEVLDLQ